MQNTVKILLLAASLTLAAACVPKAEEPAFKFREDGTFKILQATDVHINWSNQVEYEKVYNMLCEMLDAEKPDLAILTGDIVTESAGGEEPWVKYLEAFDKCGVPFALTYGNHDRENVLMDSRMAELITSHPACVSTMESGYLDDMAIEVKSSDGKRTAAVLYVMDSGDYPVVAPTNSYGWIPPSQLRWYDDCSLAYKMANGGVPVPSYMFMHIPFNEYRQYSANDIVNGTRDENECPGTFNSGMYSHIRANADVHGVFSGHDHVNDYIADACGVALVYGRFSGGGTTYTHEKSGVRIIQLKEGEYGFRSWVRDRSGAQSLDYAYNPGVDYSLHKACKAEGRENGALLRWYDGAESLDAMIGMGVEPQTVPMPRHECHHSEGPHGFGYECYIYVPETGLWRFRTGERKDGCIKIDDVLLSTAYECNITEINLEKGFHKLDVKAWIKGGRSDFKLTWMSPSSDRLRDVPAEYFFVK